MKIDKEGRIKKAKKRDNAWRWARGMIELEMLAIKKANIKLTIMATTSGGQYVNAVIPRANSDKVVTLTSVLDGGSKYEQDVLLRDLLSNINSIAKGNLSEDKV